MGNKRAGGLAASGSLFLIFAARRETGRRWGRALYNALKAYRPAARHGVCGHARILFFYVREFASDRLFYTYLLKYAAHRPAVGEVFFATQFFNCDAVQRPRRGFRREFEVICGGLFFNIIIQLLIKTMSRQRARPALSGAKNCQSYICFVIKLSEYKSRNRLLHSVYNGGIKYNKIKKREASRRPPL